MKTCNICKQGVRWYERNKQGNHNFCQVEKEALLEDYPMDEVDEERENWAELRRKYWDEWLPWQELAV